MEEDSSHTYDWSQTFGEPVKKMLQITLFLLEMMFLLLESKNHQTMVYSEFCTNTILQRVA